VLRDNVPMTTAPAHEFFLASAGVAGALIGLLFVAISVNRESIVGARASEVQAMRAAATLTAFTNALTVALFGLVPRINVGGVAEVVAIVGLLFVIGALVRVGRAWRAQRFGFRDLAFLAGLLAVFVIQLVAGLDLDAHGRDSSDLQTICVLVIVCFLIGISRAWELVGGANLSIGHEITEQLRRRNHEEPREGSEDA
jgi:hypothetical protein